MSKKTLAIKDFLKFLNAEKKKGATEVTTEELAEWFYNNAFADKNSFDVYDFLREFLGELTGWFGTMLLSDGLKESHDFTVLDFFEVLEKFHPVFISPSSIMIIKNQLSEKQKDFLKQIIE